MAAHPINVLSLCSGYGGLDLAIADALERTGRGSRTVCYVEREAPVCAVLARRMETGGLDPAPIWSDLGTFNARAWRGAVDLVCAGFPCQPVSLAGARLAQADPRWLWPVVQRVVADCDAPFVFLENVPGLVSAGLGDVLEGLASLGFDATWGCYSAAEIGAPHRRDRWFCLAYAGRERLDWLQPERERGQCGAAESGPNRGAVADADKHGLCELRQRGVRDERDSQRGHDADGCGGAKVVGNTDGRTRQLKYVRGADAAKAGDVDNGCAADPANSYSERRRQVERRGGRTIALTDHCFPPGPDQIDHWHGPQPAVRRGSDGTSGRVDRLRMLGNGVVWQQASFAFTDLLRRARGDA